MRREIVYVRWCMLCNFSSWHRITCSRIIKCSHSGTVFNALSIVENKHHWHDVPSSSFTKTKINWMSKPEKPNHWNMLHAADIFANRTAVCNANLHSQTQQSGNKLKERAKVKEKKQSGRDREGLSDRVQKSIRNYKRWPELFGYSAMPLMHARNHGILYEPKRTRLVYTFRCKLINHIRMVEETRVLAVWSLW